MDQIRKQSRIARRRLTSERFLGYLPWTMSVALLVAIVGLVLPKLMHLPVEPVIWFSSWIGGTLVVAVITNFFLTFVGRPTLAEAALQIDQRFALRERLSSALVLSPEDRDTELGQALAEDANRRAEKMDVRDKFAWGFHGQLLMPLLPAVLAALLWFVPNMAAEETVAQVDQKSLTKVKNSTKPLLEQIKKKRKQAEQQGLSAAVDHFKKLEGELAKLQKDTKLDTKQTLAKLNDIKDQLKKRKEEIGGSEALKKNLKNLSKFEAGPAEKLADALKQGDFEQAEKSLEELLNKMKNGELDKKQSQQLEKQLEQLEKAMADAAAAHEQAKQALQEQISQAEAAGDMQKAAQLQRKLEQMQGQEATMAQMQQMASKLSEAQQAMKNGDMQAAQEALQDMASQMQQMNQSDRELQDLDELMDTLSESKSQMMSEMGQMPGQFPGQGMGEGAGRGDRPEEETDTDFFDSRVRDRMKRGETVYAGKVGGKNRKGATQVDVQDAVLTSFAEDPEPSEDSPLPKTQQDHTRAYFNSIRERR